MDKRLIDDPERLEFLKMIPDESKLRELLAFIFGDGGHYTEMVGTAMAVWDAENKLHKLRTELEELREENKALNEELKNT